MRKKALFIFLVAILAFQSAAGERSQVNIFDQFLSQISINSTPDEIKKTIVKAENFYRDEKKNAGEDQKAEAKLSSEFAAFRRKIETILNEKFRFVKKDANFLKNLSELVGMRQENYEKSEKLYREVIKIYKKNPSWEDLQIAEVEFELARLQMIFEPPIPDMNSPSKQRMPTWKEKRERLAATLELFSHALAIREKLLPGDDEAVLLTELYYAIALIGSADFEKALSLFEKYTSVAKTKYGENSKNLVPALKQSLAILRMIGDAKTADVLSQQILSITGKKEDIAENLLFVTPRANSFSYTGMTGKDSVEVTDVQNYTRVNPEANSRVSGGIIGAGGTGNLTTADVATIPIFGNIPGLAKVVIVIDENGKVIEATAQTKNEKLKKKAEKDVLGWEFKPFQYKNESRKMKGYIFYYKK